MSGGVGVTGIIEDLPGTVTPYPVTLDTNGKGGLQSVPTQTDRDAIPANFRKIGMVVTLQDTGVAYKLTGGITNGDWAVFGSNPGAVLSVFARTGNILPEPGDYNTDQITDKSLVNFNGTLTVALDRLFVATQKSVASVTDLANLDAGGFSSGIVVQIPNYDAFQLIDPAPAGTVSDGVNVIDALNASPAVWVRLYTTPASNQSYSVLYVDGASGSDGSTTPASVGTPLKTLQEAFNRIARLGLIQQSIVIHYSDVTTAQSFDADLTGAVAVGGQIQILISSALTVLATQTSSSFTTPDPTANTRGAMAFPAAAYATGEALAVHTSSIGWVTAHPSSLVDNVAHFFDQSGAKDDPNPGGGNTIDHVSMPNLVGNVSARLPAGMQIVLLNVTQSGTQVVQGPPLGLVFSQCKITGGASGSGALAYINCLISGVDKFQNAGTPTQGPGDLIFQNCTFNDRLRITGGADVVFLGSTTCYSPARLIGEAVNLICEISGPLADWSFWGLSSTSSSIALADATHLDLGFTTVWGSNAGGVNTSFELAPGAFVSVQSTNLPTISGATSDITIGSRKVSFAQLPVVCPQVPAGFYFEDSFVGSAGSDTYLTAQAANIGATNVFPSNPRKGSYRFSGYASINTPGTAGIATLNAIFTDDSGVQRTVAVATTASIVAANGQGGVIIIETNGTSPVQFSVTGIVTAGALSYSVRVSCTPESSG